MTTHDNGAYDNPTEYLRCRYQAAHDRGLMSAEALRIALETLRDVDALAETESRPWFKQASNAR